jgi:CDP-paratose synthetase
MRIVVTGATGYLGSHLVRALLARGDQVAVLSRDPSRCAAGRLAGLQSRLVCTALTAEGMRSAVGTGADAVLHLAASYGRAGESADQLVEANVRLPLSLMLAAGTRIGAWLSVGSALPAEVSPYALSKQQHAQWLRALPPADLAPRVHLPFQQFYGPGDDATKFPMRVVRTLLAGGPLAATVGTQVRDMLFIDDAVAALVTVLDRAAGTQPWQEFAVGSGEPTTVRSFIEAVHRQTGERSRLDFGAVPLRPGEPAALVADTTALRNLGWVPRIPLAEGIARTIAGERPERSCPTKD